MHYDLLRVVTIGSRTGVYGGPFDTARRQCTVASELGLACKLFAGSFVGDFPHSSQARFDEQYARVKRIWPVRGFSLAFSLRALFQLRAAIRHSRVVHVSYAREVIPFVAAVLALLMGARLVLQPHGMLTSSTSVAHKIADIPVRFIYNRASKVVALTESELSELRGWSPKFTGKYVVLGNPVPRSHQPRVRNLQSSTRVVFIARLHKRKRVDLFVGASDLLRERVDLRFRVIGPDGGDADIVMKAAHKSNNLEYIGAVSADRVSAELDESGLFVLTSEKEPWGNVLASALDLGVPVIVPASAALSFSVEHYGAGVVVPDNNVHALVAAINLITSNAEIYQRASTGALELADAILNPTIQQVKLKSLYSDF